MITLELNIKNGVKKVSIKEDVLFNAILSQNPKMIKKLIKSAALCYKVSDAFFTIINNYVDFTDDGISLYPGLIIRTGLDKYAVLYLEGSEIDEEYMIKLIKDYIYDTDTYCNDGISIDKFEIDKKTFLNATKDF